MRRVLAFTGASLAIFIAGMLVGRISASDSLVWLTITNSSTQPLGRVCFSEDRFNSHWCLETPPSPGASTRVPVPARGEVGYAVSVEFADGRDLQREFYAESGYRVTHEVSEGGIGYDVSAY